MLNTVARNTLLGRNVMKTIIRNGSHGGIPGENLPFSITSRTRFTINFFLYTGTGLAAPFLIMLYQMHKNSLNNAKISKCVTLKPEEFCSLLLDK